MQLLRLLLISALVSMPISWAVADEQTGEAINRAGMQRMLSQRIAKSYFFKGLGENPNLAQTQLEVAIDKFESNLRFLKSYIERNTLTTNINVLERDWKVYKSLVTENPTKKGGRKVLALSDALLSKAHGLTILLQEFGGGKAAELINISGRQRMLSQRISKLYMAYCWGVIGDKALDDMMESLSEYEVALDFLKQSPLNSKKIDHNLRKVTGQLKFAQRSFDKLDEGSYLIYVVNSTTDTMLNQMNDITGMYVDVMGKSRSLAVK